MDFIIEKDVLKEYTGPGGDVTVPSGVKTIGYAAFRDCRPLVSVSIPPGVTVIGDSAFRGCEALTSVVIPPGVTRIDYGAFKDCKSLSAVSIPPGVTRIEGAVFRGCEALSSVSLPSGVTEICPVAFKDCKSLASVSIPSGATEIGGAAFRGCRSLTACPAPPDRAECKGAFDGLRGFERMALSGELISRDAGWWANAFGADKEGCALFLYALARRRPDAPLLREEGFWSVFDFLSPPRDAAESAGFLALLKAAVRPPRDMLAGWIEAVRERGDAAMAAELLAMLADS